MTTNDLISELRDWADVEGSGSLAAILNEAADTIEDQDERLAIASTEASGLPIRTIYINADGSVSVTIYKEANHGTGDTEGD